MSPGTRGWIVRTDRASVDERGAWTNCRTVYETMCLLERFFKRMGGICYDVVILYTAAFEVVALHNLCLSPCVRVFVRSCTHMKMMSLRKMC